MNKLKVLLELSEKRLTDSLITSDKDTRKVKPEKKFVTW